MVNSHGLNPFWLLNCEHKRTTMYKDIISYELAENVTEEHLMNVARKVYDDWMKEQPGFVKWQIHRGKDGSYTDIVYWMDEEDAKEAEKTMAGMPHSAEWYACYKPGSISSKNLHEMAEF